MPATSTVLPACRNWWASNSRLVGLSSTTRTEPVRRSGSAVVASASGIASRASRDEASNEFFHPPPLIDATAWVSPSWLVIVVCCEPGATPPTTVKNTVAVLPVVLPADMRPPSDSTRRRQIARSSRPPWLRAPLVSGSKSMSAVVSVSG
ncbi:hypothetical protein [Nannocystis pusilla]|uniref:hypothetical protein n=1 Tax=Nannocystis pusilla TaxID=889268 RepID=UPI003DA522B1